LLRQGELSLKTAFGRDINEFYDFLYMPETYIVYRFFFEKSA